MIDSHNFFAKPVKNEITYGSIRKITAGKGDFYTTGCMLDYAYFKEYHKLIAIDLSKWQVLNADPKVIQQINLTGNLECVRNATISFIIEEVTETILDFAQGIGKVL